MFRLSTVVRLAICSSALCFILTCLVNLKHGISCSNSSASQQKEALRNSQQCCYGIGVNGERKGTNSSDGLMPKQNGGSMTQSSFAARKNPDPVEFQVFQDSGDHLMYLYDRLLTSIWEPNPRNLAEFRKKLMKQTNSTFQDEFVLTHHNVRVGDSLPYTSTNARPNRTKVFYKLKKNFFEEDVLPISPLSGKRFKRCSVVGNGGILSDSKCGKEIDQSDYVIRSNIPPIRPHAVDAGWKTNLTTMNPSIVSRRYNGLKTKEASDEFAKVIGEYYGVLWLPCVASIAMGGLCFKAKHVLDNYGVRNPQSTIGNPFHYQAVIDFWKERNLSDFPSTGFYMTHLALTMCEETHLYGFWPFPYRVPDRVTDTGTNKMRKVQYHYFDKMRLSKAHSFNDEFAVLLQMHVLGVLKLHVRDCGV